jgi:NUMOD4 motif/HNH endonuclease
MNHSDLPSTAQAAEPSHVVEEWRDIDGYEGFYQISNRGQVASLQRQVKHPGGGFATLTGRILKESLTGSGYPFVALCRDGMTRQHMVHRLVAKAFLGSAADPRLQVNHKNGNKVDNQASNLEWVTPSQNLRHAVRVGLHVAARGEATGSHRLTENQVRDIRTRYGLRQANQQALADEFGVHNSTISDIVNFKKWKHV